MEEDAIKGLLVRLKIKAGTEPTDVGLGLGEALYREASRRGLITLEEFSWIGSGFLTDRLPAFERKHFVFVHPGLDDWEFRFGEKPA